MGMNDAAKDTLLYTLTITHYTALQLAWSYSRRTDLRMIKKHTDQGAAPRLIK